MFEKLEKNSFAAKPFLEHFVLNKRGSGLEACLAFAELLLALNMSPGAW